MQIKCDTCRKCCEELYTSECPIYENLTLKQKWSLDRPRLDEHCPMIMVDGRCAIDVHCGFEYRSEDCKKMYLSLVKKPICKGKKK